MAIVNTDLQPLLTQWLQQHRHQLRPRWCLAFSGGLDSSVLLHLLAHAAKQHAAQLRLIHVNHQLQSISTQWVEHCQQVAAQYQLPFSVITVEVRPRARQSLEACARDARYQALAQSLAADETLFTAHHQDDQLETLLLALARGSGVAGLAAMPMLAELRGVLQARPLLTLSREQLQAYAEQHQLIWIEDPSNQDARFLRNGIRHQLLTPLKHVLPQIAVNAQRSSAHCAQAKRLLDELAQLDAATLVNEEHVLNLALLQQLSVDRQDNLLRYWLAQVGIVPQQQQLAQLKHDVIGAKADAMPCFHFAAVEIRRYGQGLYAVAASPVPQRCVWSLISGCFQLADGAVLTQQLTQGISLRAPQDNEQVSLHFGVPSGRMRIVGRAGSRDSKELLKEYKVPPWLRRRWPCLYYNDVLVAVVGLWVMEEFASPQGWQFDYRAPAAPLLTGF